MNTRIDKQTGKRHTTRNPSPPRCSSRHKLLRNASSHSAPIVRDFPDNHTFVVRVSFDSMRHTVVISDIHLCEVEPGSGEWMRYRQRASLPDAEIGKMLDDLCQTIGPEPLTLVLNGDIFDFDAPRVVDGISRYHDLPRTAEHSVPAMAAILDDHPLFVDALARVLRQNHEIVFVSGNHDAALTLPEVRALLTTRLSLAVAGTLSPHAQRLIRARIHFRAWFHITPDHIVIEHGHLYDPYCAFRYPMAPYLDDDREIVPTIGSIGTRVLVARLGYFNPHVDRSFNLTRWGYALHWARYYLFTRRSVAAVWMHGVACIAMRIQRVRSRQRLGRAEARRNIVACVRETGARLWAVARHARLLESPEDGPLGIARDLWVDRIGVFLVSLIVGIVLAIRWGLPWGGLSLLLPFVVFPLYDRFGPRPRLVESWECVTNVMHRVAKVHRAKAVIFGHTHHPFGEWNDGVFCGNSGSWSAAVSTATGELLTDERPLIWLKSSDDGELEGGLYVWRDGGFEERAVRGEQPRDRVEVFIPTNGTSSAYTD